MPPSPELPIPATLPSATLSPPHSISASPSHLATTILASDTPLPQIAAELNLPLPDLVKILKSPDAQSLIASIIEIESLRADHREARARLTGLTILEAIAKDPDANVVERRRAAVAMIRPSRAPATRGPRAPERPKPAPEPPTDEALDPEPPAPTITPDLAHSPRRLAEAIAADLRSDSSDQALSTIRALRTNIPHAPITDEDLLLDRLEDVPPLSPSPEFSEPARWSHPNIAAEGSELTITDPPTGAAITLRFLRYHQGPWRLFDINTG